MKVLVVEDGDIGRMGRTAALEMAGHDVAALRWAELVAGQAGGAPAHDVLVAVLTPDRASWDRYATVSTLATVVGEQEPGVTTVALLDADALDNPVLALRLSQIGVDRLAGTAEIRTVDDMHRVVTDPSATVAARPDDIQLLGAGVAPGSDPEAVVAWVAERLAGPLGEHYRNAFDPRYTQNACGLTRRQAHTLRSRLAALGRIRPNPCHSGGGPVRDRSLPRWTEVVTVVNLCRGLAPDDPGSEGEGVGGQAGLWRAA